MSFAEPWKEDDEKDNAIPYRGHEIIVGDYNIISRLPFYITGHGIISQDVGSFTLWLKTGVISRLLRHDNKMWHRLPLICVSMNE